MRRYYTKLRRVLQALFHRNTSFFKKVGLFPHQRKEKAGLFIFVREADAFELL
jgi:hypothetical protein